MWFCKSAVDGVIGNGKSLGSVIGKMEVHLVLEFAGKAPAASNCG